MIKLKGAMDMTGKNKCKILKDIRRKIAEDNDISFVTSECRYQGECSGTCPKCEAELRYLEQELKARQKAGKAIAVAGIAAALVVGSTGCALFDRDSVMGDVPNYEQFDPNDIAGGLSYSEVPTEEELVLMGDVPAETEPMEEIIEPLMGEAVLAEDEDNR